MTQEQFISLQDFNCFIQFFKNKTCTIRCGLFYFICHTIITKNIGKEEKKKWRGDLTETVGAYETLGLLELYELELFHIN